MSKESRVREITEGLGDVTEKLSHGAPAFFYKGKRQIAMLMDNHHGSGRCELWVAAPPGAQEMLISSDAQKYFRPPYVGPSGWVGMVLDGETDWDEVAGVLSEGHAFIRSKVEKR